eukprot:SAG31_NODE_1471_length_8213_cov_71.355065_7_plen_192_part_00
MSQSSAHSSVPGRRLAAAPRPRAGKPLLLVKQPYTQPRCPCGPWAFGPASPLPRSRAAPPLHTRARKAAHCKPQGGQPPPHPFAAAFRRRLLATLCFAASRGTLGPRGSAAPPPASHPARLQRPAHAGGQGWWTTYGPGGGVKPNSDFAEATGDRSLGGHAQDGAPPCRGQRFPAGRHEAVERGAFYGLLG